MSTYLMIFLYFVQLFYDIYAVIVLSYFGFEYMNFNSYQCAKLVVFNNKWRVKVEDESLKIYRDNVCLGNLEYQKIKHFKRIIKVDKWYEIDCLFGSYKEIEPFEEIKEKPDIDMFMIGFFNTTSFVLASTLFFVPLNILCSKFNNHINENTIIQNMNIILGMLFMIAYVVCVIFMNYIDRENKKKHRIKIKDYDVENSKTLIRFDLNETYFKVETVGEEYENYLVKVNDHNEVDPGYFHLTKYGKYQLKIFYNPAPVKVRLLFEILHLISLPIRGLYVLIVKRYKADWFKRISPYKMILKVMKEINNNETIEVYKMSGYYDEEENKYYPTRFSVKESEVISEEFLFSIYDIRICYHNYIKQVLSMPVFFITVTICICVYNNMKVCPIILAPAILAVITFVLGIPHIKKEYQRMLELEEVFTNKEICEKGLFINKKLQGIKKTYEKYFAQKLSDIEIYEKVYNDYQDIIGSEEEPFFWYVLAYTQCDYGRLNEEVKNNTLRWIKEKGGIYLYEDSKQENFIKMLESLEKLVRLNVVKKSKPVIYELSTNHPWDIGDIYAYQFHTKEAENRGLYNKYILFQKVGDIKYGIDEIYSIIQVYDGIFEDIPSLDDIKDMRILPLVYSPGDHGMPENIEDYFPSFDHNLKSMMVTDKKNRYPLEWFTYVGNVYIEEVEYKLNEIEYYYWNENSMEEWLMNYYYSWLGKEY